MALSQETADSIANSLGTVEPFVAPLNPVIPLVIEIVKAGIKAEPKLEALLKSVFSSTATVTEADFDAAIEHIRLTSYRSLVPASALTADEDPSTPAAPVPPTP